MNNTWKKYLSILAVALILLGYVYMKNSRYEEKQSNILDDNSDTISLIEIHKLDATLRLEKSDSLWVFADGDTGNVAQQKVTKLFEALSGSKTAYITDKVEKYTKFNVDSSAIQLYLYSGEKERLHLYIGNSSTNYNSDYIRYENDPKVYMTSGKIINTLSESADFWR